MSARVDYNANHRTTAPPMDSAQSPSTNVSVSLGERSYEIRIGAALLADAAAAADAWLAQRHGSASRSAAIITDRNVTRHAEAVEASLKSAGWTVQSIVFEPGERSKSLDVVAAAYDRLVAMHADRSTVVVA